jgi:hypothetical protein
MEGDGLTGGELAGGYDLRVAGADDSLNRISADAHYARRNDYDEAEQEGVLDQVLAVFCAPQNQQQLPHDHL